MVMSRNIYIVKALDVDEDKILCEKILKAFKDKNVANGFIGELEAEENIREVESKICARCTADFEKEANPSCYEHEGMDPACLNEVFIYPEKKFELEEVLLE